MFASTTIQTNRDRDSIYQNQAESAVGGALFNAISSRDDTVLELMKIAFISALNAMDDVKSRLVDAFIQYHSSTTSNLKDDVLNTIKDVCFGNVTIVNDMDAQNMLQVLYDIEDWSNFGDLERPKKPLLIVGDSKAKKFLSMKSMGLTDVENLTKSFLDAKSKLDPQEPVQLPFPKLHSQFVAAGLTLKATAFDYHEDIVGPNGFLVDDNKNVYISDKTYKNPVEIKKFFATLMGKSKDLSKTILDGFMEEATKEDTTREVAINRQLFNDNDNTVTSNATSNANHQPIEIYDDDNDFNAADDDDDGDDNVNDDDNINDDDTVPMNNRDLEKHDDDEMVPIKKRDLKLLSELVEAANKCKRMKLL